MGIVWRQKVMVMTFRTIREPKLARNQIIPRTSHDAFDEP